MKGSIKLLTKTTVGLAAILMASQSYADSASQGSYPLNAWYGSLSGDLTWLRHSDTGGGGNVAIGYRFPVPFRLEAEAGYHTAGGSDGYSSTHYFTYMGNMYYDFTTAFPASYSGWNVVPYIGGGLGDAEIHSGGGSFTSTFHHHDNEFAWQGMGGLSFVQASMPGAEWSVGYRYLGTDTHNLHANNIELGVKFHF